jgi:hypothetical protein
MGIANRPTDKTLHWSASNKALKVRGSLTIHRPVSDCLQPPSASFGPGLAWAVNLTAYRICLILLARRDIELHDETVSQEKVIGAVVEHLGPNLIAKKVSGQNRVAQLLENSAF